MKAHIGVDADSGLVHTVTTTAANAHDITQAAALLHGQCKAMDKSKPVNALMEQFEKVKASIRAKVEHPFRVAMRDFEVEALRRLSSYSLIVFQML